MPGKDSSNTTGLHFDPRPPEMVANLGYNSFVRNTTINFMASQPNPVSMPLSQLYSSANSFAIVCDHDYFHKPLTELFLDTARVTSITADQAAEIELATRGQSGNPRWHAERCLRLHASKFGRICKSRDHQKLASQLVTYQRINAPALRHGQRYESHAIRAFEAKHDVAVQHSGIVVSHERPYIAGSPDCLLSDCVVEVKCPYSAKDDVITPETVPYLYLDEHTGLYTVTPSHDYYYQIQGLMYVTQKPKCCFIVLHSA